MGLVILLKETHCKTVSFLFYLIYFEGKSYLQTCAEGVIFDPKIDACTTPDQSARPECQAGEFLGFECPKYDSEE